MKDTDDKKKDSSKLADYKLKTYSTQLGDKSSTGVVYEILKSVKSK